ncbi:MAG: glycosyltransferase [Gammaproteobacteria bacterium]|nr:glycosyltransferase [Gammaproteobacteria bacterium]MBU2676738.1 glycosyltransferase [Gammaproteobacteria bacterium]NNC57830.1 glycosyltransferase [Woeseiaceae bacterium]NNL50473.1 glycosyltransferase [Woeseiaceae bacterium]
MTVVICTRSRPRLLLRALESVTAQQSMPKEILVVANMPPDDTYAAQLAEQFPAVRLVYEPREGLDFARNRALRDATTEWLLYVDDDVVLDRLAVHELGEALHRYADAAVVNGRVLPLSTRHPGERLFEANGGFDCGAQSRTLAQSGTLPWKRSPIHRVVAIGNGCCMAIHRDKTLAIGGFDDALDLGAALGGGGDLDIYWRLVLAGHAVIYEPRIRAQHEHRETIASAVAQIGQHQAGLIVFLSKAVARGPINARAMASMFLVWRLLKPLLRLGKAILRLDVLRPAQAWHVARMNWAYAGRYQEMRQVAASRAGAGAA